MALVAALAVIGTIGVSSALAVHDDGLFELDKDATNNKVHLAVGYLTANINATATQLQICQILPLGVTAPVAGETIEIRQETMLVVTNAAGNFGGNCAGAKRLYTVDRSGLPANTSQAGGSNNEGAKVSVIRDAPAAISAGADWDGVFDQAPDCESLDLVACTFVADGLKNTTFTGGSTKDGNDIPNWLWNNNSTPQKAEILNAYSAKGIDENGAGTADDAQILYFGMDRLAVDGSTDIGFWFFKNEVFACPDPDAGDACDGVPNGAFAGTHAVGDILILGTFTQGGATSNIRVFKWVASGGSESTNIEGPTGSFGDCVPGSTNDQGCATVNNTTINVPWNYTFAGSSTSGWIPLGGFFEGGVDLTANNLEGCFASFLAETRSSPSLDAVLLDFALGSFESCGAEVTTTPSDAVDYPLSGPAPLLDSNDNDIPDITLGTGAAGADVTDAMVVNVTGTQEWDGTATFYLCGPIPTDQTCDGTTNVGVPIGDPIVIDETTPQPIISDLDGAHLTEAGYYCWRGLVEFTTSGVDDATDSSAGECFEVLPVTPTLTTESVNGAGEPFSGTVPFGANVYDKATLDGTADQPGDNGPGDANDAFHSINADNGNPADGTITFTLKEDLGTSCGDTVDVTSGDNPEDVAVSGDDDYFTSGAVPANPGVFGWTASYDGSSPNTLSTDHNTDCTKAVENITVQQLQPSLSTAQTFIPNDAVTVTVAGGAGALDGQVTFGLWVDDATCGGTADQTFGPFDVDAADVGHPDIR
jgi:hypothetical protein